MCAEKRQKLIRPQKLSLDSVKIFPFKIIAMDSASENEYLSADSLESDGCKMRQKKKKLRLLSHKKRRTYLELYQSRLVVELLNYQKCENEHQVNGEKIHAEKQQEVRKKLRRRRFQRSENVQQNNSKIEMLKRATEYGCRMSSLNRINSLCKMPHKHQRQISSSSQSLLNDNSIDENASASKISITKMKEKEKSAKESTCEMFKRKSDELQARLEQMQIRHCQDKRKVEKIRASLMSNGIDEIKMKEL